MGNSLFVISPYKAYGIWVFDDERVGLSQEPFVGGADTILDAWTKDIPDAEKGFRLVFSAEPFPGYQHEFEWRRPEMSGNVYYCAELEMEGWLCPALFKYFSEPPARLYGKADAL
ncbi:MAG: hypothetical protein JST51_00030 [Armatimonadetes bacterium]|nr:hypothetical protein [Armatimonadota bacterium]